jgi:hypothetical protein
VGIVALATLGAITAVLLGLMAWNAAPPPARPGLERSPAKGAPMGCKMTSDDTFFSRDDERYPRRKP